MWRSFSKHAKALFRFLFFQDNEGIQNKKLNAASCKNDNLFMDGFSWGWKIIEFIDPGGGSLLADPPQPPLYTHLNLFSLIPLVWQLLFVGYITCRDPYRRLSWSNPCHLDYSGGVVHQGVNPRQLLEHLYNSNVLVLTRWFTWRGPTSAQFAQSGHVLYISTIWWARTVRPCTVHIYHMMKKLDIFYLLCFFLKYINFWLSFGRANIRLQIYKIH